MSTTQGKVNPLTATIRDVMQPKVLTTTEASQAKTAYELMRQRNIHHLPVINDKGAVVGIVSDRDILRIAILFKRKPKTTDDYLIDSSIKVSRVMTKNPFTVSPSDKPTEAVKLILNEHISALPVVDQGCIVGIVTIADLLRILNRLLGASTN